MIQMWLYLFLILALILFYKYGYNYCKAMTEYTLLNNVASDPDREDTSDYIIDEIVVLIDTICKLNIMDILLQCNAIFHSIVRALVVEFLNFNLTTRPLCWVPIFFLTLPHSIQLSKRFEQNNCIIDHNNNNYKHKCNYIKILIRRSMIK